MYHPRFKGTHYEAGYNYGSLMKKNGVTTLGHLIKKGSPYEYEFGVKSLRLLEEYYSLAADEIRGLADGLEYSYDDLGSWLMGIFCFNKHGCSCFAMRSSDNIILGRTSDFFTDIKKISESALYRLNGVNSFIGNATAMVLMEDGMNDKGLAVGLNMIIPTEVKPGINLGFVIRYLLEYCTTVDDCINAINNFSLSSTGNIIMLDKNGDMTVAETRFDKKIIRYPKENENHIISVNHFLSKDMGKYNDYIETDPLKSRTRYQTIDNALKNNEDKYTAEYTKEILSGKKGFLCDYRDRTDGTDTIWASVYDAKNKDVFIAEGNPMRTQFKEDTRSKFLK